MTREHIVYGVCGPVYVNETATKQHILCAVYLNETVAAPVVVSEVTPTGGGGGRLRRRLPQYYSRRNLDGFEQVQLPQEEKANEVALEVLPELADIQERLNARQRNFDQMLAQAQRLERIVATYIESHYINALMAETKARIYAARDAEIARLMAEAVEADEISELMQIL